MFKKKKKIPSVIDLLCFPFKMFHTETEKSAYYQRLNKAIFM